MLLHGPFTVTCQHYLAHMHVFKVQTRVKHVMHGEKAGCLVAGTGDNGCICHSHNRNKSMSNVTRIQGDERSAARPGDGAGLCGLGQAAAGVVGAGRSREHAPCFLGPDG